ncbi:histidine kinase [Methylorubrum populi]
MADEVAKAVGLVSRIEAVPTILEVVCRTTGMGFATVARVTKDRWIACEVRDEIGFGLKPGGELKVETTICDEIRDAREPVVIPDVAADPVFSRHPTPSLYGFSSYASFPILLPGGEMFGTLCALDRAPREFSPHVLGMFRLFAELIAFHVGAHMRLAAGASDLATSRAAFDTSQADLAASRSEHAASAATLVDERVTAELREQFIAVLGHDLRNPLASIDSGTKLLARENLSERGRNVLDLLAKSVGRMTGLIDDVLDFARGRLGGGIAVERAGMVPLAPMLRQVVAEIEGGHPDSRIEVDLDGVGECRCDPTRIGQLLSNLLANAVTHGAPDSPVRVRGATSDGVFELAVTNSGEPIPPAATAGLFKPYVRASERPSKQGLGLGLYIASEIAKAHGGTLEAVSTPDATTFTFRMPS